MKEDLRKEKKRENEEVRAMKIYYYKAEDVIAFFILIPSQTMRQISAIIGEILKLSGFEEDYLYNQECDYGCSLYWKEGDPVKVYVHDEEDNILFKFFFKKRIEIRLLDESKKENREFIDYLREQLKENGIELKEIER